MSKNKLKLALVLGAMAVASAAVAAEDQFPLVAGDYWEVSGIKLKDGGTLKYAQHIAGEWKKDLEFSKSKGWIKDYKVFVNVYPRAGEPDVYLVTIVDRLVSGAEGEKRNDEYMAWQSKSIADMEAESGNRAEYRELLGNELLQEYTIRP